MRSAGRSSSRPPSTIAATSPAARPASRQPNAGPWSAPARRERAEREQHRDHREVLEQGHGEGRLARHRLDHPALGEDLQRDRRRRHRAGHAHHDALRPRDAEAARDERYFRRDGDRDLQQAQPEDRAAQRPQPARLELQPDEEQQHHDTELGHLLHEREVGDQPQAGRSDRDAGDQVAEHRAEPEPLEQRHHDHRGGQVDQRGQQEAGAVHQPRPGAPSAVRNAW